MSEGRDGSDRVFSAGDARTADRDTLEREWNNQLRELHAVRRERDHLRRDWDQWRGAVRRMWMRLAIGAATFVGVICGSAVFVFALAYAIMLVLRLYGVA